MSQFWVEFWTPIKRIKAFDPEFEVGQTKCSTKDSYDDACPFASQVSSIIENNEKRKDI